MSIFSTCEKSTRRGRAYFEWLTHPWSPLCLLLSKRYVDRHCSSSTNSLPGGFLTKAARKHSWVFQDKQNEANPREGEEIKTVSSRFPFITLLERFDDFMKQTWDDLFLLVECSDIQGNMGCPGLNKALCRLTCLMKSRISRIDQKGG